MSEEEELQLDNKCCICGKSLKCKDCDPPKPKRKYTKRIKPEGIQVVKPINITLKKDEWESLKVKARPIVDVVINNK
jgi:hypothetical protein